MPIIYRENSDITRVASGIIGHGVNCQGVMGAGVALAIRRKWPSAYEAYLRNTDRARSKETLGSTHIVRVGFDLFIANCYTQEFAGNDGKKYADLSKLEQSVEFVYSCGLSEDLHFPQIGCGLGGLDWETEVRPVFERLNSKYSNTRTYIHTL